MTNRTAQIVSNVLTVVFFVMSPLVVIGYYAVRWFMGSP